METGGHAGEDDDDPVVQEFPVYLTHELAYALYVLQYPLRRFDRPYTDAGFLQVRSITLCWTL